MFKRRNPRSFLGHTRELFWPSMGWLRAARYAAHRVIRLSDSTHRIAGGLAVGASISFSPLVGTHFLQCAGISYALRFNILASLIGTAIGNPWTFPLIWWAGYKLGVVIFSLFGWSDFAALPEGDITISVLWDIIKTHPLRIFLPWMVGGYLLALLVWFPAYFLYYPLVKAGRAARLKLRQRKLHKVAREITGQQT